MSGHAHDGLTWDAARRLLHGLASPAPERVPLGAAIGRVTSEPVRAPRALPHYESSAMDGWAIAGPGPWRLVAGSGSHRAGPALAPGTAAPILTGGALPAWATGVLRSEHGVVEGGTSPGTDTDTDTDTDTEGMLRRRLMPESAADSNIERRRGIGQSADSDSMRRRDIRPAAEEAQAGDELVPAGRRLSALDVSLLATAGIDEVAVAHRPRAAVFVTGDEVVAGGMPDAGQVRDAFSAPISALLTGWGAEVVATGIIPDAPASITAALTGAGAAAPGPSLIITTGGTAHSAADHLRAATAAAGYEPVLDGVDLRPGRHTFVACRPGTQQWVACLPGNPLAAFCALVIVVEPLLAGLLGLPHAEPAHVALLADSPTDVPRVTPVVLDGTTARPVAHRNAHMLRGLAGADALAVQPAGTGSGPVAAPVFPLPLPR